MKGQVSQYFIFKKTDMAVEEKEALEREKTVITKIIMKLEGKKVKTLVDTDSEVLVISESHWKEFENQNKNVPTLLEKP